jgi:hypothetical protein
MRKYAYNGLIYLGFKALLKGVVLPRKLDSLYSYLGCWLA